MLHIAESICSDVDIGENMLKIVLLWLFDFVTGANRACECVYGFVCGHEKVLLLTLCVYIWGRNRGGVLISLKAI